MSDHGHEDHGHAPKKSSGGASHSVTRGIAHTFTGMFNSILSIFDGGGGGGGGHH